MKRMKQVIILCMLIVLFGLIAGCEIQKSSYVFEIDGTGVARIIAYLDDEEEIFVPAYYKGFPVIEIKSGVFQIGSSRTPKLKKVVVEEGIRIIGEYAFANQSMLESVVLPDSITSIGKGAFSDCTRLKEINIPPTIVEIAEETFAGCASLENIILPHSVQSIGASAFLSCIHLTDITFGNELMIIGEYAFSGTFRVETMNLPDSVEEIGLAAFSGMNSLREITVGKNIKRIGYYAFASTPSLQRIVFTSEFPPEAQWYGYLDSSMFSDSSPDLTIYVPLKSTYRYKWHHSLEFKVLPIPEEEVGS